jgi:hypothetical protein
MKWGGKNIYFFLIKTMSYFNLKWLAVVRREWALSLSRAETFSFFVCFIFILPRIFLERERRERVIVSSKVYSHVYKSTLVFFGSSSQLLLMILSI